MDEYSDLSLCDGWYQDLDSNGNIRWYNDLLDLAGPVVRSREDMEVR